MLKRRKFFIQLVKLVIGTGIAGHFSTVVSSKTVTEVSSQASSNNPLLTALTRQLLPHSELNDSYYSQVATHIEQQMTNNVRLEKMIEDGIDKLDGGEEGSWMKLSRQEKLKILNTLSNEPFFNFILQQGISIIYRHPDVWKLLGYEGSSVEYGGYLHRGFNDIDWLTD